MLILAGDTHLGVVLSMNLMHRYIEYDSDGHADIGILQFWIYNLAFHLISYSPFWLTQIRVVSRRHYPGLEYRLVMDVYVCLYAAPLRAIKCDNNEMERQSYQK